MTDLRPVSRAHKIENSAYQSGVGDYPSSLLIPAKNQPATDSRRKTG
jgi:hypothetical protein